MFGKIHTADQPKIFKSSLRENNTRHLLRCHASLWQAKALCRINRVTSRLFGFLQEQRPTRPVVACVRSHGAALLLLGRETRIRLTPRYVLNYQNSKSQDTAASAFLAEPINPADVAQPSPATAPLTAGRSE